MSLIHVTGSCGTVYVLSERYLERRDNQLAKGSVESTHKVPTSHYHTKQLVRIHD
jgi:hypothetical protein